MTRRQTLEFYDQPQAITLDYNSASGLRQVVRHKSDFLVLRQDAAGWEEWKTEDELNRLAEHGLNRYRQETGRWRCPPGDSYAGQFRPRLPPPLFQRNRLAVSAKCSVSSGLHALRFRRHSRGCQSTNCLLRMRLAGHFLGRTYRAALINDFGLVVRLEQAYRCEHCADGSHDTAPPSPKPSPGRSDCCRGPVIVGIQRALVGQALAADGEALFREDSDAVRRLQVRLRFPERTCQPNVPILAAANRSEQQRPRLRYPKRDMVCVEKQNVPGDTL